MGIPITVRRNTIQRLSGRDVPKWSSKDWSFWFLGRKTKCLTVLGKTLKRVGENNYYSHFVESWSLRFDERIMLRLLGEGKSDDYLPSPFGGSNAGNSIRNGSIPFPPNGCLGLPRITKNNHREGNNSLFPILLQVFKVAWVKSGLTGIGVTEVPTEHLAMRVQTRSSCLSIYTTVLLFASYWNTWKGDANGHSRSNLQYMFRGAMWRGIARDYSIYHPTLELVLNDWMGFKSILVCSVINIRCWWNNLWNLWLIEFMVIALAFQSVNYTYYTMWWLWWL